MLRELIERDLIEVTDRGVELCLLESNDIRSIGGRTRLEAARLILSLALRALARLIRLLVYLLFL